MLAWQLDLSGACDHNVTRPFGRRSPPIAANLLCVDYSLVANDDVGRLDDRTEIEQETKEQPLAGHGNGSVRTHHQPVWSSSPSSRQSASSVSSSSSVRTIEPGRISSRSTPAQ